MAVFLFRVQKYYFNSLLVTVVELPNFLSSVVKFAQGMEETTQQLFEEQFYNFEAVRKSSKWLLVRARESHQLYQLF